jgi:3-phosphoshikimate 1-carboxyvinyltransferase
MHESADALLQLSCPGSKSMTQRALIIAALAREPVVIAGALECDDSRYLSEVLRALGITVRWEGTTVTVNPAALRAPAAPQFVGNAGTAMRFSSCLSLLIEGELSLDGDARMRQRPIGSQAEALQRLGVTVRYLGEAGYPPIALQRGSQIASEVALDISLSSQYASGLLLVAPRLPQGLTVVLQGQQVSLPYLRMTCEMMRGAGVDVNWEETNRIRVAPGSYQRSQMTVEPDWSTAAFLLGAAEIAQIDVELPHLALPAESLQGDAVFLSLIERLRQPGPHEIDLRDAPDLIAPLTAVALFARDETTIRGVAHARVKECDRIAVLCRELSRIGAEMHEYPDGLRVVPLRPPYRDRAASVELDPESDHRMAMTFGLAGLRVPGIVVREPECVSKSFPEFWSELERIRAHRDAKAGRSTAPRADEESG